MLTISTQYRNKLLLVLELLNESDTVCLPQLYIVSIGVLFNRTLIIVVLSEKKNNPSDKLRRLQNHAARVLTYFNYDAYANELMKILGWKNIETQRQIHKAQMAYKSLNGIAPNYLSSKFIQRSDIITS